jgi:hypothetical protein
VLVVTIFFFFFWEVGPGALHSISRLYEFELGACRAVTAQSGAGAGAAAGPRASLRRGGGLSCPGCVFLPTRGRLVPSDSQPLLD